MRQAYTQAGWSPADVELIECHATGTPVGDAVEIESLKELWGRAGWDQGQCAIGSIKSNIGHTLTAAGAAALLKVLLALEHRELPPTANFEQPAARLGLDESPFRILSRAEPWPNRGPGRPRRAAISGFGFGGINAHVLIEEWVSPAEVGRATPSCSRVRLRLSRAEGGSLSRSPSSDLRPMLGRAVGSMSSQSMSSRVGEATMQPSLPERGG